MPDPRGADTTLRAGFLRSASRFGDRNALFVDGAHHTYADLETYARRIAATLLREDRRSSDAPKLTAVLGHRHLETFAGILGVLLRGDGYVPLNPVFPTDRTRAMLVRSGVSAVVVDASGLAQLEEVLTGIEGSLLILAPAEADLSSIAARWPAHRFLGSNDLADGRSLVIPEASPDDIAYLLFTSGSTGQPKGVMVAHRNVRHFLDVMAERYGITEEDRFSHTFDLTFDLSVFDLFLAWERGACVCCPTAGEKMLPGKYVTKHALTVWFSVPSTAVLMNKLRMLKPGAFPSLRWALFCGEALPAEVTQTFASACPSAITENLYGPTELTIACTLYRWDHERSPAECHLGVVPIGQAYPGMEVLVCDESLHEVAEGQDGELLMTGPQMALGYYRDAERTAAAFVIPPNRDRTYYRTGDRVRRMPEGQPLVYLGRVDNQIKIQGYRVELGEIEAIVREVSGADVAIAIGFPRTPSGADGVVAFVGTGQHVAGTDEEAIAIRSAAATRLPPYMQPREIRFVGTFPLNANGKIDRKALLAILEAPKDPT
ncbi:MAG: amino acid adenylation domain-containing protein [Deltaproteobacteria bacterium]|nr:amino acid adenylation domain-containing protein [Deltaproteobacteria bacterium]